MKIEPGISQAHMANELAKNRNKQAPSKEFAEEIKSTVQMKTSESDYKNFGQMVSEVAKSKSDGNSLGAAISAVARAKHGQLPDGPITLSGSEAVIETEEEVETVVEVQEEAVEEQRSEAEAETPTEEGEETAAALNVELPSIVDEKISGLEENLEEILEAFDEPKPEET